MSPSISPSVSPSVSLSPSLSPSISPSLSPSISPSLSPSLSPSISPSISASVSPSPSPGWEDYTRGDENVLPADDTELETAYSVQDYIDVSTKNDVRVAQIATDEYTLHQFKNYVGTSPLANIEWEGQSDLASSSSTVCLQIYNRNSTTWETVDSDNTTNADTDFTLTAHIANLTNYKNASNVISCRVYQEAI